MHYLGCNASSIGRRRIALKWRKNGEVTEWNPVFAYATLEMGVGVELCWPYRAQQKGSVENLVGFVKSSFFKVRRFHDAEDLRQQLRAWHEEVNQERPCRATGIIPALRLAEEAPRLRALKVQPEQLQRRMQDPIPEVGKWLRSVLSGHFRYYGVPGNGPALHTFRWQVGRHWHRVLSRRSQKGRVLWARMKRLIARWLPPARIVHPYPSQRLIVHT